jgi:5-methylcytosine-specific restriction endonuclease McrA
MNFKPEDVINKYGENTFCYLTGDRIDISKPRTYSFDHKIPRSRGGENTLDNLGICTKIVNTSKTDMTPEEYIELCKKVLEHNGYNVTKSV